jgi:anaerobic magnesium-protoporphyrin IX monomethyl ester cyclase
MNQVLLTNAYFYRFDPKQWQDQKPYPPYGTIYTAAVLREAGFEVALLDTNLRKSPNEIAPFLENKPNYLVIYDDGFNYLSKMCLSRMRDAALELIALAKPVVQHIIVCSSDSTDHAALYLKAGADFILLGEGELTLVELLQQLNQATFQPKEVLGIAYLEQQQLVKTPRRPVLRDLDQLPDPAWDLIDVEAYRAIWLKSQGYFSLNIATTRGCPFKCNWCAKPIYGNRYNSRSPQRVAREMQFLINHYQATHFWICDDIFGLKPGWVQAFRDEIRQLGIQPRYKIQSRVDLLLQEDTIDALVDTGLQEVWVGAESGSQSILDAMDKGTKVAQIYEATRLLKAKKVAICFFLQFGYLGESRQDIDKTIKMVLDLMPHDIGISVSYPLPGTKFFEKVRLQLEKKQNWVDSDDLAMMYEATFSPAFYKKLHRYVHKRFRLKQGWQQFKALFTFSSSISSINFRSIFAIAYYLPSSLIDQWLLSRLRKHKKVNPSL